MSSVHVVSRSVRDSAALLDATAGPDVGAPYWAVPPQRPYLDEVGRPPGRLHIAWQTRSFNGAPVHPDCAAAADIGGDKTFVESVKVVRVERLRKNISGHIQVDSVIDVVGLVDKRQRGDQNQQDECQSGEPAMTGGLGVRH